MNCCKLPLLTLCLAASAFGQAIIEIASSNVTARDLAHEVTAFAQADPTAIIARAPVPGASRRVAPAELQRWANSLGLKPESLPEELTLRRAMRRLTSAEIENAARAEIDAGEVSVELLSAAMPSVPSGEIQLECLCERLALNQPALLRLRWREPGGRTGVEQVQAVIRVKGRWLEAATDLLAGAELIPSDVIQRYGPLPSINSYLTAKQLDDELSLMRSVKAGQALTGELVRPMPLVSRGDLVELRYEAGGIRLRSPGRAETSGGRGEVIPFHNVATGGRVSARLVNQETAYVEAVHAAR